jgi:TP901-1 family phage major tail protein
MEDEILNGSDLMLFIKQGTDIKTIALATSHKVSIKMKTRDTGSKDTGYWEAKAPAKLSWSISADNMVTADGSNYKAIKALMIARTAVDVYSSLASGTAPNWVKATGGDTGKAYITGLDEDGKDQDNATFSITLEGTGPYVSDPVI